MTNEEEQINTFIQAERNNLRTLEKIKCGKVSDEDCKVLMEKCPRLYSSIVNGTVDLNHLIKLKKRYINIYTEKAGSHKEKKFYADKNIGQELAMLYFYPSINQKPTFKQLRQANEKLKKKL